MRRPLHLLLLRQPRQRPPRQRHLQLAVRVQAAVHWWRRPRRCGGSTVPPARPLMMARLQPPRRGWIATAPSARMVLYCAAAGSAVGGAGAAAVDAACSGQGSQTAAAALPRDAHSAAAVGMLTVSKGQAARAVIASAAAPSAAVHPRLVLPASQDCSRELNLFRDSV
jgi:hypothetical protein